MSTQENFRNRFEELHEQIDQAQAQWNPENPRDLNTLEQDIAALLTAITQSDPKTAKAMQPFIADLIQKLDTLETYIKGRIERE